MPAVKPLTTALLSLVALAALAFSACTSTSDPRAASNGSAGQGGTAGATGGTGATAGVGGSGGTPMGEGGSGATTTGTGGTLSGGAGGTAGAGTGGTGAAGPGGSGGNPSKPSAGCGTTDPPTGERQLQVDGEDGPFIVSLPSSYDPNTPYPLGFAFHGFGRTHQDCQNGDCAGFQSTMGEQAILVYMKSFGPGWEQSDVRDQNADFFAAALALMKQDYCVDENRVFVAGTSSGAHFTNVLACRFGEQLLAVAPVAGYMPEKDGCNGTVAAVVIHGIDDSSFSDGEDARDFYVERNGCTTTTIPDLATAHTQVRASRDAMTTDHACVDYQGCDAGVPVRWCEHSEGGYDNSTHGWPTAGGQIIWDFVQAIGN